MQISSRFTMATHILILIARQQEGDKVTSDYLAGSVGVNPVIIRKTLSQLKKAQLIDVARGTGGAWLKRPLDQLTLLDVYQAVESLGPSGQLFGFHDNPNPNCEVGRHIHDILDTDLAAIQAAMEARLAQTTLADLVHQAEVTIDTTAIPAS